MLLKEGLQYPQTLNELYPLLGLALISQILGQGVIKLYNRKNRYKFIITYSFSSTNYSYFVFVFFI